MVAHEASATAAAIGLPPSTVRCDTAKAGAAQDDFADAAKAGRFAGGCAEDVAGTLLELVAKGAEVAAGSP